MSSRQGPRKCCCARRPPAPSASSSAEIGEAVIAGEPILTLIPERGIWFGFNLREDALAGLSIGARVPVRRAGAADAVAGTVTEMRDRGDSPPGARPARAATTI